MATPVHTMVEEIELAATPKAKAILRGILEPGQVWDKMKIRQVDTLEVKNRRWKSLPTVGFAHIGEAYGTGGGKTEAVSFGLKHLGHDLDIAKVYDEETAHIVDPRALQTQMVLKSLSYLLNDVLFNGDEASDPRQFNGLKKISADLPSRQTVDAALTANGGDGTSLDIRNGGASESVRHALINVMVKSARRTEDGQTDLIVMNENFYDLFEAVVRRAGLMKDDADQFERTVASWRGIPFVDAGFKDMDGAEYILADDHDVAGAVTPCTSAYFLKIDPDQHIGVLQTKGLDVRTIGELQDRAVNRYRLDWTFGVVCWGKRSMVRLKGVRVG